MQKVWKRFPNQHCITSPNNCCCSSFSSACSSQLCYTCSTSTQSGDTEPRRKWLAYTSESSADTLRSSTRRTTCGQLTRSTSFCVSVRRSVCLISRGAEETLGLATVSGGCSWTIEKSESRQTLERRHRLAQDRLQREEWILRLQPPSSATTPLHRPDVDIALDQILQDVPSFTDRSRTTYCRVLDLHFDLSTVFHDKVSPHAARLLAAVATQPCSFSRTATKCARSPSLCYRPWLSLTARRPRSQI